MASKLGLAGGIPERRVRPIWDAIDSRQFKNALKHVTSLLGKHPNSPYALALKALILERMGKSEEALSVCLHAKELLYSDDSALMDDLTLSTLQMVFQRLDHLDLATSCYEYACGKFSNNLDLMMGLFNCYVREYSFVKQQQTAIKMYKIVAEERFLLWAVCSIHLQALKALILERMGKSEEALSVCLHAKELLYSDDSALMDDLTLSTLQMVFQRLDHLDLATSCYEYACGKFSNNLDLMMGLFNCYVREYSFVKQQQTAIKMYKIVAEERFLLWAVCSIHLQVLCGNGGEKLLVLAEGLLRKHVATHSLHEPEALVIYISLLEQQEKYGDALEILSGKLGSLLAVEVDRLRIQGRLLARAGDYDSAADTYQKILELCPDDWDCFQNYLGCLLKDNKCWSNKANDTMGSVDEKFVTLDDVEFDSRIAKASELVNKLQEYAGNNPIRGPYLAHLEIERRKHLHGKGEADKLMEALIQYFARFGQLACFASDVEVYLQVLSPHGRMEFIEKMRNCSELVSSALINALGQSITIFKVQELIGGTYQLSMGDLRNSSVQMFEMYCKNLHYSKDLDPQESMHGEELLSLACNILVQLYWRTNNIGYALEAIMVLEFGLTIRRFVWQYKILLLHLYSHLGAISLAYERYKSLEVKNILMETISHHILPQMLASPLWLDLSNLLTDYLKFMDDHLRESADLTFLAYRNRSYSKVIEFVQFKENLQRSNQYLIARIEAPLLQLKQNAGDIDSEERLLKNLKCGVPFVELSSEIGSKSLTFNEELESRPWWTPCPGTNYLLGPFEEISYFPRQNSIKDREAKTCKYIERRSLLPRMIYLSVQNTSAFLKDSFETNGAVCDAKISAELEFLLERYSKILGYHLPEALEVIGKVSNGSESLKVFGSDMIDWMNIAVFCNAWKLNLNAIKLQDAQACKYGGWHIVDCLLEKCIMERIRSVDSQTCFPGSDISALTQLIMEPLAWHGLIIQSCVRMLHPSVKKKKKSGQADLASLPLFGEVRDTIHSLCKIVEEVIKWVRTQIKRLEDEMLDAIFSALKNNSPNEGPGQIFQILETLISSASSTEYGGRISAAIRSWSPADVARKVVAARQSVFLEFLSICESRYKSLEKLKQQIDQV